MINDIKITNSKIKKIKEPDFSKEIEIHKVKLLPRVVYEKHLKQLRKQFPTPELLFGSAAEAKERAQGLKRAYPRLTDEMAIKRIYEDEIDRRIHSFTIRQEVLSRALEILIPCYEIEIDQKDLLETTELLKKFQPDLDNYELMAKNSIIQRLIFNDLKREWNITISDEDAKKIDINHYEVINEATKDLTSQEKTQLIKDYLIDENITNRICKLLKHKIDIESIAKQIQEIKKTL